MLKCAVAWLFFPVYLVAVNTPRLPLAFEENRGQAATGTFLARGKGYGISLSPDAAVISGVTIRFVNANRTAASKGEAKLPGVANYIRGSAPGLWTRGVPTYERVRFQGIYPGIDVVYYGNGGHLEFDLIVAPGSDSGAILLDFEGAEKLAIDAAGNLRAVAGGRDLRIRNPEIYQEVQGIRKKVEGCFYLGGSSRAGFRLKSYDKRRALVIDPTIVYSTVAGGSGADFGASVAVDASGSIYLTGSTYSADLPVTPGAPKTTINSLMQDLFITKLNAAATAVIYSTYIGVNGNASALAVDSAGNAVVVGSTSSPYLPQVNALLSHLGGGMQGFILKLNPAGTTLVYSSYLGGTGSENTSVDGLALDSVGNAYVTGSTEASNFPTTSGAYSGPLPAQAGTEFSFEVTFLSKFGAAGALTYSSLIGQGEGLSVAVDSLGSAYVTGYTDSFTFPATGTLNGTSDAFVLKMNPAGTALVYSTFLGGSDADTGQSIAVNTLGQAYVTGYTKSLDFPVTVGAAQTSPGGGSDSFVAKFDAAGSSLLYATYLGGRNDDFASGIALDGTGNAVVVGQTSSPNFPVAAALQTQMGGSMASFSSFNPSLQLWQPADSGFHGIARSVSLNPGTGATVIGTDSGTYRSQSTGGSWNLVSAQTIFFLSRSPSAPSILMGFDPDADRFYTSLDDGQTWSSPGTIPNFSPSGITFDPSVPSTVYAYGLGGSGATLARSTDSGQSFTLTPALYPINVLAVAPGTPNIFLTIQDGQLSRSLDSGVTWTIAAGVSGSGLAQDPNAPGTFYAFGSGAFLRKTTDAGATWVQISTPAVVTALAVAQGNSAKLYAATAAGVIISSDSGGHWSAGSPGLGSAPIERIVASASTAFTVQAIGPTGFVTKLNPSGTGWVYSTFLGGTGYDAMGGVAMFGSDAVVTGYTTSTDFPLSAATSAQSVRVIDAFVTRISDNTPPCSYSLRPASLFFYGTGGSSSVGVVAPAACAWNAAPGASWLSIASNSSSGTAPLSIAAAANTGSARTSTVTVGGQPVVVQQGSASCTYSLSGYAVYLPFAGGSGSVAVAAGAGCDWVTANNNSRISVTAGSTGNGNGVVAFSAPPVSATGTIAYQLTIAGIPFSLYQSSSNISQSITFPALGTKPLGTAPFAVSATATSGLPVVFASTSLSVCTVSGVTVTLVSGGLCSLTATQPGNATYGAAPAVTSTFVVNLALRYVPIAPCRVADTRKPAGPFGAPSIAGQTTRNFDIPGSGCGVPASAQAYSLNVVVVPHGPLGYLTVWPAGQTQPLAATLNSDGRIKANAAIVAAGTAGAITFFASNTTDLVLDINGYFVSAANPAALAFYPVIPCRITDTRKANGLLGSPFLSGQVPRTLPIRASSCGVPSAAQAYSLNFTAVPHGPLGYLTVWQTGQTQPTVSTLNAPTAAITANAAIVPAGTNGSIDLFASNDTDMVIDINGYFAPPLTVGLSFYNLQPCRILDSRIPRGTPPFSGNRDVAVAGACGTAFAAQAFALNATVVPAEPLGYLTLWAQGATQPTVSTLNASDVAITDNMAVVPTANGSITAFASNLTHLVLDILGFFAP